MSCALSFTGTSWKGMLYPLLKASKYRISFLISSVNGVSFLLLDEAVLTVQLRMITSQEFMIWKYFRTNRATRMWTLVQFTYASILLHNMLSTANRWILSTTIKYLPSVNSGFSSTVSNNSEIFVYRPRWYLVYQMWPESFQINLDNSHVET